MTEDKEEREAIENLGKRFEGGEYNLRGGNCSVEARKGERL